MSMAETSDYGFALTGTRLAWIDITERVTSIKRRAYLRPWKKGFLPPTVGIHRRSDGCTLSSHVQGVMRVR